jgi:hypothetical protein
VALSNVDGPDTAFGNITLEAPLAAGGSIEILLIGTWTSGQQTSTATASGEFTDSDSETRTDTDTDSVSYFGADPAISLDKTTNGSDEPIILVGQTVNWEYLVTNTGNVELSDIAVTDNKGVIVSCPSVSLAVGQSMTCTAVGVAAAGDYSNLGTVSGSYGDMVVTASDASSYFGADPRIEIQKTPDTQTVIFGQTADFTIAVKNTGNVSLTSVTVSDPRAPLCDH